MDKLFALFLCLMTAVAPVLASAHSTHDAMHADLGISLSTQHDNDSCDGLDCSESRQATECFHSIIHCSGFTLAAAESGWQQRPWTVAVRFSPVDDLITGRTPEMEPPPPRT